MNVAIIPARGGSKRIPKKNTKLFLGKAIIGYSIETALASGLFDRVIVSTDDEEIAAVAREFGAEVPFLRPPELSNDHTATLPVIRHAIEQLTATCGSIEFVCCIYATAPFVQISALAEGLKLLERDPEADFAFSVTSFPFPIQRALRMSGDGQAVEMFWPENEYARSQDLLESFHDAGQFYWGSEKSFLGVLGFYSARSLPVVLPRHRVQDIDTPEDWERAERMFAALEDH